MTNTPVLPEAHRGPAEKLLSLVLGSGDHLWHNRVGLEIDGKWFPARRPPSGRESRRVAPGLHVTAAVALYSRLLEIQRLNRTLMAHFASYALLETDWRDLKVTAAALMLVQDMKGDPIRADDGSVGFFDDDYRAIGEAMLLHYEKRSSRMMTPKAVLRVAELLEVPAIAALNRAAGFGDPASKRPPLGRWRRAAEQWLRMRERNRPLLQGLVAAGYKETIKKIARKVGYKPDSQAFFEVLGWAQKQADAGHRVVGLGELELHKRARFDGLTEEQICERIVSERLTYKDAVGRLPAGIGLTPAIMAALLPSLSDTDLRILSPTLEALGLLEDAEVKARWEKAIASATDQRALNLAKNLKSKELRAKLEEAADHAVQKAVKTATDDADLEVVFLIDKSGSMEAAIEQSKEALSRILGGFALDRLHVASFDTIGTVLKPKASSRAAVQHMLKDVKAGGGTIHGAGVHALARSGLRIRPEAKLIVIVAGDEDGESGADFARALESNGLRPAAMAMLLAVAGGARRGSTVRSAGAALRVPFSEIDVGAFMDPYQVPRALAALLDAPVTSRGVTVAASAWVEKVMSTPLLEKPVV